MTRGLSPTTIRELLGLCISLPEGNRASAKKKLAEAGFVERSLDQDSPARRRKFEQTVLSQVTSQMLETYPNDEDSENLRKAREHINLEGLYEANSDLSHEVRIVHSDDLYATYTYFDAKALDAYAHSRGCGAAINASFVHSGLCDLAPAADAIRDMGITVHSQNAQDQSTRLHFGDRLETINGVISVARASEKVVRLIGERHDVTFLNANTQRFPPAGASDAAPQTGSRS